MGDRLRTAIVSVVVIAWIGGLIVPMVFRGFVLDPVYVNTLNGAFMAVVGFAAMSYSNHHAQGRRDTEVSRRNNEPSSSDEETAVE